MGNDICLLRLKVIEKVNDIARHLVDRICLWLSRLIAFAMTAIIHRRVIKPRRVKQIALAHAQRARTLVFVGHRVTLPPEIAEAIGQVLRALQHYEEVLERSTARVHADTALDGTLLDLQQCFATDIRRLLAAADTAAPAFSRAALDQSLEQAENRYQALKRELLAEAAAGRLPIDAMDRHMLDIARLRRSAERAAKAAHRLAPLLRTAAIGSTDARADTGQRGNGASPASLGA
jgi:hypothetical protein